MNESTSFGPSFGLEILVPVTLLLLVPLALAFARSTSTAARFVLVALWLRYIAGAYHLWMFRPLVAGLSGNAVLSIATTAIGLLFIVRFANLAVRWLLPVYLLMAMLLASAVLNDDPTGAVNAIVKYLYYVVIAIAVYQAHRRDPEGRFVGWLMVAFLPLAVFQWLSVILHLPKGSELEDGLVWIGGYNHEAAFSVALVAGFVVGCFARAAHPLPRLVFLLAMLVGIQLAGYRTAIFAMGPLALATLWVGITTSVRRDQRPFMAGVGAALAVILVGVAVVFYGSKFADIATFAAHPGALIKPPSDFTWADKQVMSARAYIWSSYLYAWKEGGPVQHVFGFGPESWAGLFKVYPHNTLVSTVYELGLLGVLGMLLLWGTMLWAAITAKGERLMLISAHASFLLLNMATMPFWQVEGLGLYGFLCGYTIYRKSQSERRPRPDDYPARRAFAIASARDVARESPA
ncbi:conserved membrane hypothetical protein [Sphingomonas sp. EC-HK361]|uniref:O-antigen ligase family protein n=1 Tax=Sphingomonas sp. EC-HK361 TaxID=2038397 RepID=UPI00125867A2|nr:O-antigen ligase family protein [Sphingomonas sp. EC-HK361]VVT00158.1 conserved membrane hypothetical protein [Sphingomonas sp. EC-HK361]